MCNLIISTFAFSVSYHERRTIEGIKFSPLTCFGHVYDAIAMQLRRSRPHRPRKERNTDKKTGSSRVNGDMFVYLGPTENWLLLDAIVLQLSVVIVPQPESPGLWKYEINTECWCSRFVLNNTADNFADQRWIKQIRCSKKGGWYSYHQDGLLTIRIHTPWPPSSAQYYRFGWKITVLWAHRCPALHTSYALRGCRFCTTYPAYHGISIAEGRTKNSVRPPWRSDIM